MPSPLVTRRSLLCGAFAFASAPGLTACQAAPALLNPAVSTWFATLTATVGANLVTDISKDGVEPALAEWSTGFTGFTRRWFPSSESTCGWLSSAYRNEAASPPFLLVALSAQAMAGGVSCEDARADPLNDLCGVVINKGSDGLLIPAWAWQTLVMFASDMTVDLKNAELERIKTLLQVALAPTSSHSESNASWAGAVEYLSYTSLVGPVDLAKVEKPDHRFYGVIKASGFPDALGVATVSEYLLPTTAAL